FSQQQPSFCQHVLQQPAVVEPGEQECILRTPFIYAEAQLDQQIILAGVAFHHLRNQGGSWKIRMKKIELLNREAALPSIQLLLYPWSAARSTKHSNGRSRAMEIGSFCRSSRRRPNITASRRVAIHMQRRRRRLPPSLNGMLQPD